MKTHGCKRLLSCLLAFVLALMPVVSELPALQVKAAGAQWNYVKAGDGNGNSHSYENADAESAPAAVLLNQSAAMPLNGSMRTKLRFVNDNPAENAKLGIFYTYQDADHWIYVGYDKTSKWYYQYKNGTDENYGSLTFSPEIPVPEANKEYTISVSLTNETLQVGITEGTKTNVAQGPFQSLFELAKEINGQGKFGFRAGKEDVATEFMFRDVFCGEANQDAASWAFLLPALGSVKETREIQTYTVSGTVLKPDRTPMEGATVRLAGQSAVTDAEGKYSISGIENGTYEIAVSAQKYAAASVSITVKDGALTVDPIQLSEQQAADYDTFIESPQMKAAIDKTFPRVMQYEMKTGAAQGKKFIGQEEEIRVFEINKKEISPTLKNFVLNADSAVYTLGLADAESQINMDMEVTIRVSENDLIWEVTKITKGSGCVKINTIEVPQLNLITINDGQENTQFKGAVNSGNVNASGDREITFSRGFNANETDSYGYGFLSADGLSAGLWSNSEALGDRRIVRNNGNNTISLTSNAWYYDYGDDPKSAEYDYTPVSELPCAKVCIAPDLNDDGIADWQDGAIAYRDIMNNPYGSENVPELVNYRIVMNLGSLGPNPFMKTADNVKKVYLATDGLPQAIMLKGFGNEGHDSANSEYGGVAERLGGIEDLKKLNKIAHQYNTQVGIHVNAQEAYPEAQTFSDDLLVPSQIMRPTTWGWMDASYEIDKIKDLGTGLRYKRFLQLYDQLNGTSLYLNKWPGVAGQGEPEEEVLPDAATVQKTVAEHLDNPEDLDYIYLDVWYQDSWESRKIAQQVNSLGWRFSTEFGTSCEYDSTWQHWATEGHYGGSTGKGNNSEVMRFLRNHQRDSFVLNYPSYGGEADNPLLGHFNLSGFEGWGGSNDSYNDYIRITFTENLPAKFLQHYLITKWVDYTGKNGDVSPAGSKAKEITLKSSDGEDTVVVTRKAQQRQDTIIERTITLNGTKVLDDGAYLLPWNDWETNQEKLYHWNYDGGATTWKLLDDWKSLQNVVVYELSDQGRGPAQTVAVTNGSITLDAKEKTAYVVVKGQEAPKKVKAEFGEGAYVTDPGFNTYAGTGEGTPLNGQVWSGDIADVSIRVKKVGTGNQYLMIDSPTKDVAVSTKLNSLIPGQNYVAQVYVDNRSDVKATLEISGAKETVSNYSLQSLAQNYNQADAHSTRAVSGSRMQIMQVSFVAAADTATLTLKREAGEGVTHFDDIRIVPKALYNFRSDGTFIQDFESVVQGYYPFVLGPAQGVTDPVTHLSEYHAPYTQSGWGSRILDDVISGQWSLKHHGANTGIIYRTIPQNFHFEPGQLYEVSFDYQSGSADSYCIIVGDDQSNGLLPYLDKTAAAGIGQKSFTRNYSFNITGAANGQSWFGLYANGRQETGDMGERDFIMDNLVIRKVETAKQVLTLDKNSLVFKGTKNGTQQITAAVTGENPQITYTSANTAIATVSEDGTVTPVAFGDTVITVVAKSGKDVLVKSVNVTVLRNGKDDRIAGAYANAAQGGEGADKVIDGNTESLWHSPYSGFDVSSSNPAILTLQLNDGEPMTTVRFQQREGGGNNGKIYQYRFAWGTNFNSTTHALTGGTVSDVITTTDAQRQNGAWINLNLDDLGVDQNTVKYLQIQVVQGHGNFASMAEFEAYHYAEYEGAEPDASAVDKAELVKAVQDLAGMNTFGLSEETIEKINQAIETANATLASPSATAQDVAAAVAVLNQLKNNSVSGNKAELERLIAEYSKVDSSRYTPDSARIFDNALSDAQLAISKAASSFDINNAIHVLQNAYQGLIARTDDPTEGVISARDALKGALSSAKALIDAGKQDYTDESWNAFAAAYSEAQLWTDSWDTVQMARLQRRLLKAKDALAKKQTIDVPGNVTPEEPPVTEFTAGGRKYRVVDANKKTVKLIKGKNEKTAKIDTVSNGGKKYTVVAIGANAFKNCSKMTKAVIGAKVTKIDKKAFNNCKKLSKIQFKGTKLPSMTKAFNKTKAKPNITVVKALKKNAKVKKNTLNKLKKAGLKKITVKNIK